MQELVEIYSKEKIAVWKYVRKFICCSCVVLRVLLNVYVLCFATNREQQNETRMTATATCLTT